MRNLEKDIYMKRKSLKKENSGKNKSEKDHSGNENLKKDKYKEEQPEKGQF